VPVPKFFPQRGETFERNNALRATASSSSASSGLDQPLRTPVKSLAFIEVVSVQSR
jgi:hypothetical protein